VLEALAVVQSRQELALDRPVGDDAEISLGDLLAAPGPAKNQKTSLSSRG